MSSPLEDLTKLAMAADPACDGVSILRADRAAEPGWTVVDRVDGLRVRLDGVGPDSPAVAAVRGADLSPGAIAARSFGATRLEALMSLATRDDVTAVQSRAALDAIATGVNDRLEFLFGQVAALRGVAPAALVAEFGRPARVLANEVYAYIQANPTAGDPAPTE